MERRHKFSGKLSELSVVTCTNSNIEKKGMIIKMINRYENILFDLDGTLTDPAEGILNSIRHSLTYYPEINIPETAILQKFIGPPLWESYVKYFGMDKKTAEEAVEHYREYFRPKGIFENKLYDGIPELLKSLNEAGAHVCLATSKPEVFARRILEHFGITKYFSSVQGSALDGSLLKKEDIISRIMSENPGITASNTVMIGDTAFDIIGAKKNGIPSIGVCYGYGSGAEIAEARAQMIVKSVEELSKILLPDSRV